MRNVAPEDVDHVDRPVLAIANDYAPGHHLPPHRHRRAQLLYGATGVMRVQTTDGAWTVPTHQAVLIPAGTRHEVTMLDVSTRSLYVEPAAAPWFPRTCQVIAITPLLRELLLEAVTLPGEYAVHGRDGTLMTLLLHELSRSGVLPFDLPLPTQGPLRTLCQRFLKQPRIQPAGQLAGSLHVSERTLHRMFRSQTGMSATQWQRRALVVHAIPLLAAGHTVTAIATDLGYATPAAFTTMFRRVAGAPPSSYLTKADTSGPERPGVYPCGQHMLRGQRTDEEQTDG